MQQEQIKKLKFFYFFLLACYFIDSKLVSNPMSTIEFSTLPNGVKIISDTNKNVDSVAIGIWYDVGSSHEQQNHNGVAHMTEHMMFKGTANRNAQEIVQHIENVGGNMNAYTSREITSYHVHLMKEDAPLALEVLADMALNTTLPPEEIERERQVILQEIGMTQDTPDDLIFDQYYETAYKEQAIGRPILGTNEIISKMQGEVIRSHIDNFYTADRTVISAAGNITHDQLVDEASKYFANLSKGADSDLQVPHYSGGDLYSSKDLEQAHVVLGFEGFNRHDDNYYAAQLLNMALGSGMSSRLFQEVREKRGLAYSIFSFHSTHKDTGLFGIYTGTGPNDTEELMPVLCDEILRIGDDLTEDEIQRAKVQIKSSLVMGRESMMRRANQQAKYLIQRDAIIDHQKIITEIDAIDLSAVKNAAQKLFSSKPTLCALGPLDAMPTYDDIAARLAA